MFRKNLILPLAAAACFLVPAATVFAQAASSTTTQTARKVKPAKTVKFTLTNQTSSPVSLKAGDQQMTLAAGQSQTVKAQSGQQIVTTSESSLGAAGTVISGVDGSMDGVTVNVRR